MCKTFAEASARPPRIRTSLALEVWGGERALRTVWSKKGCTPTRNKCFSDSISPKYIGCFAILITDHLPATVWYSHTEAFFSVCAVAESVPHLFIPRLLLLAMSGICKSHFLRMCKSKEVCKPTVVLLAVQFYLCCWLRGIFNRSAQKQTRLSLRLTLSFSRKILLVRIMWQVRQLHRQGTQGYAGGLLQSYHATSPHRGKKCTLRLFPFDLIPLLILSLFPDARYFWSHILGRLLCLLIQPCIFIRLFSCVFSLS